MKRSLNAYVNGENFRNGRNGQVVAKKRWLLRRGGRFGRFDCIERLKTLCDFLFPDTFVL